MAASFFFYDLETSGFDARQARIVQFAGQRTDLDLKPVGQPVNCYVKMTPDILPDPDAVLVTGITPQMTLADGLTEAEFLKLFYDEVVKSETIFVGFNNVRFDDEFMRFINYRNFYDAYEWQWAKGCSRWDLLDVIRMTRALKPDGIKWPFAPDGKPTNRLEFLTKLNKLSHDAAHDALSDVLATIDVARLIKTSQPKLFEHLLKVRKKDAVKKLVDAGKPFMYASGRYKSEYLHTTAAVLLARQSQKDYALVYDLRFDPRPFAKMSVSEIIQSWKYNPDPQALRLPVKTLKYNRCPAVVPGVVSDQATLERLKLNKKEIAENLGMLQKVGRQFADKIFEAVVQMDRQREISQQSLVENSLTVDQRLYEGFIGDKDKQAMREFRAASPNDLDDYTEKFHDARLQTLSPLYKARNFPKSLTDQEALDWEKFRAERLLGSGLESRAAKYFARLAELDRTKLNGEQRYILEELQLYGQSIIPGSATD